jgi:N-formylglutamate amidohydrolase
MNAGAVFPAADACAAEPPFLVRRPPPSLTGPLVFASPHSGRVYPARMMAASLLDGAAIRRSEDAFVDQLIAGGVDQGAVILAATHARAFIDLNRAPYELDQEMFADALPAFAQSRTARVAAGLGAIARIVAEGHEIYNRKLTFAEAQARIADIHQPYHAALGALVGEALDRHGVALLVDWHSMPAAATRAVGRDGCDMVLGGRFGAACAPAVTGAVESALTRMGYRVARNVPYAGGYTTELYGQPSHGKHGLQIEINRALYLDEATVEPHAGFDRLRRDLEEVFATLAKVAAALAGSAPGS